MKRTKPFADSFACRSRAHCLACRTLLGWRAETGAPAECPHGVTVADLPEPVEPAPRDTLLSARRREVCQGCGWTCGLDERKACYVKRYLNTPESMCPEGYWAAETLERIYA